MVDCPFRVLLVPVRVQFSSDTLFFPSITTPSDAFAISVAAFAFILAVEYIAGEPFPVV